MSSPHMSLQSLRAASQAKELADKRAEVRRKSLLILVHHFLKEEGYKESAGNLAAESRLNTEGFSVCDNIDLSSVFQEYEAWHVVKYQRYPRFAKRVVGPRPQPKPHKCDLHDETLQLQPQDTPDGKKSPFFRRRSLPRQKNGPGVGRAISDPNLSDDQSVTTTTRPRTRPSVRERLDNKKREQFTKQPLTGRRGGPLRSPEDEKKDPTKSSSDTDSEKGGVRGGGSGFRGAQQLVPVRTAKLSHQVLDLKAMINEYTKLEENIGDIGKGQRGRPPMDPDSTIKGDCNGEPGTSYGDDLLGDKLVKATMPCFTGEFKELASTIQREILVENPGVKWSEVLGLEDAKRLLKEAVIYPLKYPQLFVGRFKPWRGILLYGPPGTGKTLLAKAVATESQTTFFNISATTLVSKWRGDSEKLVRVLFEMARFHAPSTIFVDEVDALMGSRTGEQEHEASRRMKTQLLVELDGLTRSNDHVFLLAASNIPWELDPAMLRRLEKRILVPLPSSEARLSMFQYHLPEILPDLEEAGQIVTTHLNYEELAQASNGYSGSDLQVVCREAAMSCLRKVFKVLEDHSLNDTELPELKLEAITMDDVHVALKRTRPAQHDNDKYTDWHNKFGSA